MREMTPEEYQTAVIPNCDFVGLRMHIFSPTLSQEEFDKKLSRWKERHGRRVAYKRLPTGMMVVCLACFNCKGGPRAYILLPRDYIGVDITTGRGDTPDCGLLFENQPPIVDLKDERLRESTDSLYQRLVEMSGRLLAHNNFCLELRGQ